MSDVTRCPECGTRFKVSAQQLAAHAGMVRCGRCRVVFDAGKHLQPDQPSPQLSLPIDPEEQLEELGNIATTPPAASAASAAAEPVPAPAQNEAVGGAAAETVAPHEQQQAAAPAQTEEIASAQIEHFIAPLANLPELASEPATLAQRVRIIGDPHAEIVEPPPRKRRWAGIFTALLLLLTLLGQALYFFRVELAAQLPGSKPQLVRACALLGCTVELPRRSELVFIESSELEADATQSGFITLHALLHNRASFVQAYPSLELTLNNLQDQPLARRTFHPADYLKNAGEAQTGLPPNRELEIALHLDTGELKPSGYRLLLFYPK